MKKWKTRIGVQMFVDEKKSGHWVRKRRENGEQEKGWEGRGWWVGE